MSLSACVIGNKQKMFSSVTSGFSIQQETKSRIVFIYCYMNVQVLCVHKQYISPH